MAAFREFRRKCLPFLPSGGQGRQRRDLLLRRLGLARSYEPRRLIQRPEWRVKNLLPLLVAQRLLTTDRLNLVQIGAFDGVLEDDLRGVFAHPQVHGALIEPQPAAFTLLQQTYAEQPQLQLFNAAIDRQSGVRQFFGSAKEATTVASFDRQHVRRQGVPEEEIASYEVACLTVADVMQQAGFETLDLLQIDAEGYDYEIIKSIDFSAIKPAILRFEFFHFTSHETDECLDLLAGHGYQFLHERKDLIAMQFSGSHHEELAAVA